MQTKGTCSVPKPLIIISVQTTSTTLLKKHSYLKRLIPAILLFVRQLIRVAHHGRQLSVYEIFLSFLYMRSPSQPKDISDTAYTIEGWQQRQRVPEITIQEDRNIHINGRTGEACRILNIGADRQTDRRVHRCAEPGRGPHCKGKPVAGAPSQLQSPRIACEDYPEGTN